jgi:hypothetical protein
MESQANAGAKMDSRAAETAAIRRRWITLGEILALIAVVISALTLWNSWSERSEGETTKAAEAQRATTHAGILVLTAIDLSERELVLKPTSTEQSVQGQTITFPTALGVAPADTTGEPRIEAEWFEHPLKKARDVTGLPDTSRGDERLPIVITTRFLVNGATHEDVALYDLGYSISGRWLGGHSISLRGISLVSHLSTGSDRARLDARWHKLFPHK